MENNKPIRLCYPRFNERFPPTLAQILASGNLTKGQFRDRFEKKLAEVTRVPYAVTFNSGTSALIAALLAVGIGPGDRVAVPDFGFVATANAVKLVGAEPVFLDVKSRDFGFSVSDLKKLSQDSVNAAVVVHQFGLPQAWNEIKTWADAAGCQLIEDSACAVGSSYNGRPLGCLGDAGILSFHPRKVVTTGEGGALLTTKKEIAQAARAYSDHGFNGSSNLPIGPGMNMRLPEISCALGLEQLDRLGEIVENRRGLGELYLQALGDIQLLTLPWGIGESWWNHQTIAVVLEDSIARDEVIAKMQQRGIETNRPATSLSAMPHLAGGVIPREPIVSRRLAAQTIGLPCHEYLAPEDIDRVCNALRESIGQSGRI